MSEPTRAEWSDTMLPFVLTRAEGMELLVAIRINFESSVHQRLIDFAHDEDEAHLYGTPEVQATTQRAKEAEMTICTH